MCTTWILVVPCFTKTFFLEFDPLGEGLNIVLMQEGHPLSFTSSTQLCERNLGKSTYDNEMKTILHITNTWQPYLIWRLFQIKSNHHSMNYFLKQLFSSREQHKWVTKTLGYDHEIFYKKCKYNVMVDVLSKKY